VAVRVRRAASVALPVRLELVPPAHLKGGSAPTVDVPADKETATLSVRFAATCGPFIMPLVVRGTAVRGDDRILAEALLEIVPP